MVAHRHKKKLRYPWLHTFSVLTRWRLRLFKRNRIEKIFLPYITEGTILDVGCGKGGLLCNLPDRYIPYGIEIAPDQAAYAAEVVELRGGKIIVNTALAGLCEIQDEFADGIIMRAFLEHETEPVRVLEEVCRVLRPNGVIILKVPNFASINRVILGTKWSGFRFPDHLNYFTPKTLRAACNKAGLTMRRFSIIDRFPTSDNMWAIAGKS